MNCFGSFEKHLVTGARVYGILAVAVSILVFQLRAAPYESASEPEAACFAFIKEGNIFVRCGGPFEAITTRGDIGSFAVSKEQAALAYVTSATTTQTPVTSTKVFSTSVIDLKTGTRRLVTGGRELMSTCGGITYVWNSLTGKTGVTDIVGGQSFDALGYSWFRCSSDKNTTVGVVRKGEPLKSDRLFPAANRVSHLEIAPASAFTSQYFNISPDGSQIAYVGDHKPICLSDTFGSRTCTDFEVNIVDVPSVSNNGAVLAAVSTEDECIFKSPWNFARTSSPTVEGSRDACVAVGYWKPGSHQLQIVAPLGRAPQSLDPELARLLTESAKQKKL